jgi:hypothetical protein
MARCKEEAQLLNGKLIVPSSTDGNEDVHSLAELLSGFLCSPAFPYFLPKLVSVGKDVDDYYDTQYSMLPSRNLVPSWACFGLAID